jgi:hypothetical protein
VLPAPLQIALGFVVGLAFALASYSQFEHGRSPFGRTLWVPVLFQGVVVVPALLYLGFVFPDWMWLYLVDPRRLPVGITILFVLVATAAVLGGYLGGWALLRVRRRRELGAALVLGVIGIIVGLVLVRGRLGHTGTFHEYRAGHAAPVRERKLGWSLGLLEGGMVVGLVLSMRFLLAEGRRDREG